MYNVYKTNGEESIMLFFELPEYLAKFWVNLYSKTNDGFTYSYEECK